MNKHDNSRDRSSRIEPRHELDQFAGIRHGNYGRYHEDDGQPHERSAGAQWGYSDSSAEGGASHGQPEDGDRDASSPATGAQRGDDRHHYVADRRRGHEGDYYDQGDSANANPAASPADGGGVGAASHGGYAEQTSGQSASGSYGNPHARPGEDFRGRGPKNYVRSDERLREDISERLTADPEIDASEIEVQVTDGAVTLLGHVDRRQTRYRVEDLVDRCHGVSNIDNRLGIGPARTSGAGDATNLTPPKT